MVTVLEVLDSLNKASRDEDNILDQIYTSKFVQNFIINILIFHFLGAAAPL